MSRSQPSAFVVIDGDDVYEDLFTAGRQEGLGRVCYLQLGHDMRCWDEPPVRELVASAARWGAAL